jgi:hypothetical protein
MREKGPKNDVKVKKNKCDFLASKKGLISALYKALLLREFVICSMVY